MAVTAAAAITLTGLAAGPARSVTVTPDPGCTPDTVRASDLLPDEAVHGLTVIKGTTPGTFTGTYEGRVVDGIADGVDMILVDLHSDATDASDVSKTIDEVGVWSGMSGSPVYDADGKLIGAVSYSLGIGPSTIAGVTPASEMANLLGPGGTVVSTPRTVALPRAVQARMVRSGVATSDEAGQRMTQLRTPYTVSGIQNWRIAKLAEVLDVNGGHFTSGSGGTTSAQPIGIQAGGNMAASESYGTVTAAGLGTATMVCGNEVVGFGHPMDFTGRSSLSLHGADTQLIQPDPTISGFKVANIGAPIGTVDNDRLAGIHGVTGAVPVGSVITSTATAPDTAGVTKWGTTHVTNADLVPDLDFTHLLAVQDKALDRVGKGVARTEWTIKGTRRSGAPFALHRTDMYADSSDISAATGFALAEDLSSIQDNPGETVKITSVRTDTSFSDVYRTYSIAKVQLKVHGRWMTASRRMPLPVRAGHLARLQVLLTSREAAPKTIHVGVQVPAHAVGRLGTLRVLGGNAYADESGFFFDEGFDFFDEPPAPSSTGLTNVLDSLRTQQQHNQVRVALRFPHAPAGAAKPKPKIRTTSHVVGGDRTSLVFAVR
jgi:hypothetical protein